MKRERSRRLRVLLSVILTVAFVLEETLPLPWGVSLTGHHIQMAWAEEPAVVFPDVLGSEEMCRLGDSLEVTPTVTFHEDEAAAGDGVSGTVVNDEGTGCFLTAPSIDSSHYWSFKDKYINGSGALQSARYVAKAKTPSQVNIPPTPANNLVYTGQVQELFTEGTATNGTMKYGLLEDNISSDGVITGTEAKEYTIWYKVVGDATHSDTTPASITSTIFQATNSWTTEPSIYGWTYGEEKNLPSGAAKFGDVSFSYSDSENGTYSGTVPTTAGTWYLKADVAGNTDYSALSKTVSFAISQATNSWTTEPSIDGWTYGGTASTPSGAAEFGDVSFSYSNAENGEYIATQPTTVGTWYLKADVAGTTDYSALSKTVSFAIAKAAITPKVSLEGWAYGEDAKSPSVTGNPGNGAVSYEYKAKDADDSAYSATVPEAAGDYVVKATVAATDNYEAGSATANFTIAKADQTITFDPNTSPLEWFFPNPNTFTASTNGGGTLSVASNDTSIVTATIDSFGKVTMTPKKNGTTTVTVTAAATTNYKETTKSVGVTVKEGKIVASVPKPDNATTTYNGQDQQAPQVEVTAPNSGASVGYTTTAPVGSSGTYLSEVPSFKDAGTHTVYYKVTADNYEAATGNYTFTINPAEVTVTANNAEKTYGEADPTLTATTTGTFGGDTVAYSVARAEGDNVGTYTITPSGDTAQGNYKVTYKTGSFTIKRAASSVTTAPTAINSTYTSAAQALVIEGVASSGASMQYSLSKDAGYSTTIPTGTDAKEYTVWYKAVGDANHSDTEPKSVKATIAKAAITPVVSLDGWTYGEDAKEPSVTDNPGNGKVTYEYKAKDAADDTYGTKIPKDSGTYTVRATVAATANYQADTATADFTISQKAATVTADNLSKTYGDADPKLTAKVTGLVGDDTLGYSLSRAEGENAGTYDITASGDASQGNYVVTFKPGTFTVSQKTVTITPDDASKTYGEDDPELTATVDGLLGNDSVKYSLSRAEGEDAGTYTITVSGDAIQGNYKLSPKTGTFTIEKAGITPKVSLEGWTYGEDAKEPSVTDNPGNGEATYEYKAKDADETAYSSKVPADAGTYTVKATVAATDNYQAGTATVDFTIAKADQTVTLDPSTSPIEWVFPDENTLKATTSGDGKLSAASDNESVVTVAVDASGKVTMTPKKDGTATVTVTAAESNNYTSATASVKVTVQKGKIVAAAAAATGLTYTGKAQDLGTVNVTKPAGATVKYGVDTDKCTADAAQATGAGTYTVYYEVSSDSYVTITGSFEATIAPKDVTVTADDLSKTYGEADPKLTATIDGLAGEDSLDYTLVREAGEDAGTYDISVDVTKDANYAITTKAGTFTIDKAEATVTATNLTKTYGEADPELTATVEGMVGEDTLDYSLARAAGEDAGVYAITVKVSAKDNYDVSAVSGSLTIKAKALTEDSLDISIVPSTPESPNLAPAVTITLIEENKTLIEGEDYELSYNFDPEGGKGTVTISFLGNYSGTVVREFDQPEYLMMSQSAKVWYKGSGKTLTFTCSGHYDKFQMADRKVVIDGKTVKKSAFDSYEGSTVVDLKPEYLETLSVGKHNIALYYPDGHASAEFEVREAKDTSAATSKKASSKKSKTSMPGTGDPALAGPMAATIALAVASLSAGVAVDRKKKRR